MYACYMVGFSDLIHLTYSRLTLPSVKQPGIIQDEPWAEERYAAEAQKEDWEQTTEQTAERPARTVNRGTSFQKVPKDSRLVKDANSPKSVSLIPFGGVSLKSSFCLTY